MAQIGEDVKLLTDDTRMSLSFIDAKILTYFRNIVDHANEKVDKVVLKAYIFSMIHKNAIAEIKQRIKYCNDKKEEAL